VTALRDSTVMKLTRDTFDEIARSCPSIYEAIIKAAARRLIALTIRLPNTRAERRIRTVVLVGAADKLISRLFIGRLRTVLERHRGVRFVSPDDAAHLGSHDDFDSHAAARNLNELELAYELLVYETDPTLTDWTRLAIRQADEVLVVADEEASPTPGAVERFAYHFIPASGRRMVVLHSHRSGAVAGTDQLLEIRQPALHHHVSLAEDDDDLESLCRFLLGQAIGFVASGGGALGPIHAAVYQALTDAGIRFDFVGGTSVGAAMMAGVAFGCAATITWA
jgi:NTE family protein